MHISINNVFYWTDSNVTLSWINSPSLSFKTFVAHKVSYIQGLTEGKQWKHVSTKLNPADLVSRRITANQILSNTLWFQGPSFLQEETANWPNHNPVGTDNEIEKRKIKIALVTTTNQTSLLDAINHRNSFSRLLRIVGFIKRFTLNLRRQGDQRLKTKFLHATELQDALTFVLKDIQTRELHDDMKNLIKYKNVQSSSKISSLTPFLDENGLIRVGGRLQATNLPYDTKHPVVLPSSNDMVRMLARELHERHLHAGPQALLAIIRQQYWPLRGKNLAQSIVHNCIQCARSRPKLMAQLMGNLPPERIQPARPFLNVGVDFCGPFHTHYKIRGKRPTKTYIAVFICFTTKAVHLELVSDLTTDAFIGALKRFIGRRGRPAKIFCDNATNFVGARNEFREINALFTSRDFQERVNQQCSKDLIQWCFIPPRTPHFGGLWEAAVKSAKYHLRRILSSASLTYEELHTVIVEVEAILNSRPITPMSNDPNDLQALSPGHFLIGEPLTTTHNPYELEQKCNLPQRWELVKYIQKEFWKRWTKEYLQQLQIRPKWQQVSNMLKPGTLVLIKDENAPIMKWPLGKIINECKGPDGLTRVVDIRTEKGIFKRAIHNLCPLPVNANEESSATEQHENILKDKPITEEQKEKGTFTDNNTTTLLANEGPSSNMTRILPKIKAPRHPNKGKFLPINSSWISNPAAMRPSNQLKKYNMSGENEQPAPKRARPMSSTAKLTTVLLTICLVLFTPCSAAVPETAIDIIPFQQHPAIYFEDIGQMSMITDNWNIIVYYNLDRYRKEMFNLRTQLRKLKEICTQGIMNEYKEYCHGILGQFQHGMNVIETNNEILVKRNGDISRSKRSPLNIVGSVANALFGLLDQEYADHISETISKVKQNENHLLELIKNQTSIIDSTANIIKQNQEYTDKQFSLINSYLNELHKGILNTNQALTDQQIIQLFNSFSIHTTLIMINYQQIQSALIKTVTDCHNGKINPLLLTPDQLRAELNLIRENLPPSLTIPGQPEYTDLLQLYSLMTAKTRVTANNVIFSINLPLLNKDVFQIFRIIPIPLTLKEDTMRVKSSTEFLAVSLHRDYYYLMSSAELTLCLTSPSDRLICNKRHAIFNKNSGEAQCELQILNQEKTVPKLCKLERIQSPSAWIQLHNPNHWIYMMNKECALNIVCGTQTFHTTLQGVGLLKFKLNCIIKQDTITIVSHHEYSNRINNSFVPTVMLNSTILEEHLLHQERNEKQYQFLTRNNSKEITHLRERIQSLQDQTPLPHNITSKNHHLSISYSALALTSLVIIGLIIRVMHQRCNSKEMTLNNPNPEPAPRRVNFQLKTTRSVENP